MDLYLPGEINSWTAKVIDIFWSDVLQNTFKKKKYDTFNHLQLTYSSSNIFKVECLLKKLNKSEAYWNLQNTLYFFLKTCIIIPLFSASRLSSIYGFILSRQTLPVLLFGSGYSTPFCLSSRKFTVPTGRPHLPKTNQMLLYDSFFMNNLDNTTYIWLKQNTRDLAEFWEFVSPSLEFYMYVLHFVYPSIHG